MDKCEIENGDIRYIPKEARKSLKGYRKTDERLRHYKGHTIKEYNLKWLRQQSKETQKKIEKELDFNIAIANMYNGQVQASQYNVDMTDSIEIPLESGKAQEKEEMEI